MLRNEADGTLETKTRWTFSIAEMRQLPPSFAAVEWLMEQGAVIGKDAGDFVISAGWGDCSREIGYGPTLDAALRAAVAAVAGEKR